MHFDLRLVWFLLAFVAAGVASGYCSGLFGIGGGILRIPVFVFLFSYFGTSDQVLMHVATGTSLSLVMPGALMAARKQYSMGKLDLDYFKTWAMAIFLGTLIAEFLLPFMPTDVLGGLFIVFLLGVACYVGFAPEHLVLSQHTPEGFAKGVVGTLIGCFSVFIGVGGGVFTAPTMKVCNVPIKNAIALATATAAVVGTVGTVGAVISGWDMPGRPNFAIGYVDVAVFLVMAPTVMFTAPLGAKTANLMHRRTLRRLYAIFLVVMAAYMFTELILMQS